MKIAAKLVYIALLFMAVSPVVTLAAAELTIKVTDEDEPVPMAEIFLVDSKTRIIINNDFTNKSGKYHYTANPGLYDITVSKDEYLDVTIKNIEMKKSNIDKVVELTLRAFGPENTALPSSSDDCD